MKVPLPLNSGQSDECISYLSPPKCEVSPPCLRVCLWASFRRDISFGFKVQSPTALPPPLQTINLSSELKNIMERLQISNDPEQNKSAFTCRESTEKDSKGTNHPRIKI